MNQVNPFKQSGTRILYDIIAATGSRDKLFPHRFSQLKGLRSCPKNMAETDSFGVTIMVNTKENIEKTAGEQLDC